MSADRMSLKTKSFPVSRQRIAVVGLGYVGLPLAVALARHFPVTGFDISPARVAELTHGKDHTREVMPEDLAKGDIRFTSEPSVLGGANIIIVAVPTPVDSHKIPDLACLRNACAMVGKNMRQGAVVIFESTVYPGVTEEICVPILEKESGLALGRDFSVGYSPERVNPGDRVHTLENVVKIVSGNDAACTETVAAIYGRVIRAGIHKAPSIKVAEAAKVIENTQRDLNIALMNEFSLIFHCLGIDTLEVLEAAGTKWNFLAFTPGLVGGHCIGVDPYYLTYKAEETGYAAQVILAGRRINDGMGKYVAEQAVKSMIRQGCPIREAKVGVLGLTFKENVPDLRNSKVADMIAELQTYGITVLVHDPLADPPEAKREYGCDLLPLESLVGLDALILAVGHQAYADLSLAELSERFKNPGTPLLLDIKGFWNKEQAESLGYGYWCL
jgi:UDP-N-acetyl-D-galactosamine dehydrogenase